MVSSDACCPVFPSRRLSTYRNKMFYIVKIRAQVGPDQRDGRRGKHQQHGHCARKSGHGIKARQADWAKRLPVRPPGGGGGLEHHSRLRRSGANKSPGRGVVEAASKRAATEVKSRWRRGLWVKRAIFLLCEVCTGKPAIDTCCPSLDPTVRLKRHVGRRCSAEGTTVIKLLPPIACWPGLASVCRNRQIQQQVLG